MAGVDAAYKRLEKAVQDSIAEKDGASEADRWRHKLERAVEVYAAAYRAQQFKGDRRIHFTLAHPWTLEAVQLVQQASSMNAEHVKEMLLAADRTYDQAHDVEESAARAKGGGGGDAEVEVAHAGAASAAQATAV